MERPCGADDHLVAAMELCHRQIVSLDEEHGRIDRLLFEETREVDDVRRLATIPGIGWLIATSVYAWVGDVRRFPNARALCAYAGLVPSVRQSGETTRLGRISRQGCPLLRRMLVQGAQVLHGRCRSEEAKPLQEVIHRVQSRSQRKKIAIVAGARHLLRVAYYILRDGTEYQPELLAKPRAEEAAA